MLINKGLKILSTFLADTFKIQNEILDFIFFFENKILIHRLP